MKKIISVITIIIGLSSISLTSNFELKLKLNIIGTWEFEKVKIEEIERNASELNNCGYKDVLQIQNKKDRVKYEFHGIEISGDRIGISSKKICAICPIEYKYVIENNSCPTSWIRVSSAKNRLVSVSEGQVIEYEIRKPNRKKIDTFKNTRNYKS